MIILLIHLILLTTRAAQFQTLRATLILIIRLRRWSTDSSSSSEDGMEIGKRFYSFRLPN